MCAVLNGCVEKWLFQHEAALPTCWWVKAISYCCAVMHCWSEGKDACSGAPAWHSHHQPPNLLSGQGPAHYILLNLWRSIHLFGMSFGFSTCSCKNISLKLSFRGLRESNFLHHRALYFFLISQFFAVHRAATVHSSLLAEYTIGRHLVVMPVELQLSRPHMSTSEQCCSTVWPLAVFFSTPLLHHVADTWRIMCTGL